LGAGSKKEKKSREQKTPEKKRRELKAMVGDFLALNKETKGATVDGVLGKKN